MGNPPSTREGITRHPRATYVGRRPEVAALELDEAGCSGKGAATTCDDPAGASSRPPPLCHSLAKSSLAWCPHLPRSAVAPHLPGARPGLARAAAFPLCHDPAQFLSAWCPLFCNSALSPCTRVTPSSHSRRRSRPPPLPSALHASHQCWRRPGVRGCGCLQLSPRPLLSAPWHFGHPGCGQR